MNRKDSIKETSPNRKKSRNEKFHKLFKIVPEDEFPIDYFSCAFISDNFMLLQGNLYISQNWFCFYSRIRGRGRLLQIPMEKVISITREKTALVFPNAIGFQTAEEKYVFGSFLTRDSTYKFLVKLWKQSTEKHQQISAPNDNLPVSRNSSLLSTDVSLDLSKPDNHDISSQSYDMPSPVDIDNEIDNDFHNNKLSEGNNSSPNQNENLSSDSDGFVNVIPNSASRTNSARCNPPNGSLPPRCNDPRGLNIVQSPSTDQPYNLESCDSVLHEDRGHTVVIQKSHKRCVIKGFNIPYFFDCFNYHKMCAAFSELLIKLQKVPRTNLLLAVCSIMVLFLLLSAFGLTYKILLLQARMESKETWSPQQKSACQHNMYSSLYYLNANTHAATVQQLHQVLQANIQVLQEVSGSLKSLKTSPNEDESCENNDGVKS